MTRSQLIDYLINSGIIDWEDGVDDCPPTRESNCDTSKSCHDCWVEFLTKDYKSHKVDSQ